jgi:hypothetical protein
MMRKLGVAAAVVILSLMLGACGNLLGGGDDLESTRIALAVQQTQLALDQAQAEQPQPQEPQPEPPQPEEPQPEPPQPEEPQPEPPQPEEPQPEAPKPEEPETQEPESEEMFLAVDYAPKEFHCDPAGGPVEMTVTVEMSNVDRGANLFWRLHEKSTDTKLGWEIVDMLRADDRTRAYTFYADMMAGKDNFFYPPGMTESWFEFQIVTNDAAERTEVFADVTFFPCP